jgi:UDP-N-acetylglucosamine:LPS N-acetylglucosamine transferase
MARSLARDLERRDDVTSVSVLNDFSVLGPALGKLLARGFRYHLGTVQWSYDLTYALFTRLSPARRAGERALYRLGGSALASTIAPYEPDVVVSTYPVMNPALAGLRAQGRLRCPVAAVVGPLGGLGFWVQPRVDLHLLHYAEALGDVERRAGPGKAVAVRPLVREEFFSSRSQAQARDTLVIPRARRVVLVSGGGWGVGDLEGAIEASLAVPEAHVIAVAGRNEPLFSTLHSRFGDATRVNILGYTDRMCELLWSADAFVTATAGLSCIEARLCGCPTVCYGFPVGHVRDNTRALVERGLARAATTRAELSGELTRALVAGRPREVPRVDSLPSAAEMTVRLARGELTNIKPSCQTSNQARPPVVGS